MSANCNFIGVCALISAICGDVAAQTADPPELVRLRTAYDAAVARAVKPMTETYIVELTKIQETYTRTAKLDEALKIANEIKVAKERLAVVASAPVGDSSAPLSSTTSTGQGVRVTIPANDPNGYRIGAVKRGDTITLQYVEGMWKNHGGIATANPDDPKVDGGDENRLVIARGAVNGAPGELIKLVPAETRKKPFVYVFQTSRDEVVLRISTNSDRKQNPGAVSYSMVLKR
ncbi:MAG: hypothetical protein JNM65_09045 [Verrucomicrobiaceae bacterium]|nr:hypothetical protein [Verrucomicrobiaceae bacterium]